MDSQNQEQHQFNSQTPQTTVAVVGSGAAGLGAAWLLARAHYNVHLFEANSKPGGHANTVDLPIPGSSPPTTIPVDTGFIVYNTKTYPDLVSLFELLGVEEENSSMSFSSSALLPSGQLLEWGSDTLATLFADRFNVCRPAMYTMLYEMNRFNQAVHNFVSALKDPDYPLRNISLAQFLEQGSYSRVFIHSYLVPMVSAVWSASFNSALEFPARSLFHFFVNHGLAQVFNRPQWRTPAKRSRDYVTRLLADFRAHGGTLHLSSPVKEVSRHDDFIKLSVDGSDPFRFDHVVFATHPPDTLKILGDDVTDEEHRILSAFKYSTNKAYVHHDERLMPKNRSVWSSWNFIGQRPIQKINRETKSDLMRTKDKDGEQSAGNHALPDLSNENQTHVKAEDSDESSVSDNPTLASAADRVVDDQSSKPSQPDESKQSSTPDGPTLSNSANPKGASDESVCVSYWLNRLQNYHKYHVPVPDLFLTLNPVTLIDPDKILTELSYDHPQFTEEAVNAQSKLQEVLQGKNRTWHCGAYARYGFHEDAFKTGLDVAERLCNFKFVRPWKSKNCLAINNNTRIYEFPYSPLRTPMFIFLGALIIINTVISRLQDGLGLIAARMKVCDPVVVVASGEGRLHRFGPKLVLPRTSSFFSSSDAEDLTNPSELSQPSAARVTVRSPKVLARIADALRQGSELAPTAAAAFAAGEVDCPSPTDLSETLRALFIADGLDDPSNSRQGRAKLAENLLFAIVGNFEDVSSMNTQTRHPELTTCLLNVVSPSWWLELDDGSKNELETQDSSSQSLMSKVSPFNLNNANIILELLGDLSEMTVALLQGNSARHATIVVQTAERSSFIKSKAEILFVRDQVSVFLFEDFMRQQKEKISNKRKSEGMQDNESSFDVIFAPGLLNNYSCCGFGSREELLMLIKSMCAPNAVVEMGCVVYGRKRVENSGKRKKRTTNPLFCSDEGFHFGEISDVLLLTNVEELDIQRVSFMDEEEAAMDIYEVIERVYNSLAREKLEPNETRSVLAQMCLWQAALSEKYLRRMAISFTLR